jgi:hypothetical protein
VRDRGRKRHKPHPLLVGTPEHPAEAVEQFVPEFRRRLTRRRFHLQQRRDELAFDARCGVDEVPRRHQVALLVDDPVFEFDAAPDGSVPVGCGRDVGAIRHANYASSPSR